MVNGKTLAVLKDESLTKEINTSLGGQTKIGWVDAVNIVNGGAAIINTVFKAADNVVPAAVEHYYSHQYNNPHENDNGGSGSTYHSGQGGNSEYDVNKRLK